MTDFMMKYKSRAVHLCKDYEKIVDELIKCGFCKYDKSYFLENDLYCDYQFDFSEESFIMDMYETNTLAVFKEESDYCIPLYCIKEAWDFMEEENNVEETTVNNIEESDKTLPLKMLSNLDILKDVVDLKRKANLNDDDTLKLLELLFK